MTLNRLAFAISVAVVASFGLCVPSYAATTISFTGGSSATDGTDGIIRSFSNGGIAVQASGWSFINNILTQAYLGSYSSGLGVTNSSEGTGGSSNSHTIDNVGQSDFVLLVFSQSVNIASGVLTPFSVSSTALDNDARVSFATLGGAFTSPTATAVPLNSSAWVTLAANGYNVNGNTAAPYTTSLNSTGRYGNVWLIGAAQPNPDANYDGFKLSSISVNSAVPEPATWAMMLIGLGAIGASMRRRPAKIRRKVSFA